MREAWKKRDNYIKSRGVNAPLTRDSTQRSAIAPRFATKYAKQIVNYLNQMSQDLIFENRQKAAFSKIKRLVYVKEKHTH